MNKATSSGKNKFGRSTEAQTRAINKYNQTRRGKRIIAVTGTPNDDIAEWDHYKARLVEKYNARSLKEALLMMFRENLPPYKEEMELQADRELEVESD